MIGKLANKRVDLIFKSIEVRRINCKRLTNLAIEFLWKRTESIAWFHCDLQAAKGTFFGQANMLREARFYECRVLPHDIGERFPLPTTLWIHSLGKQSLIEWNEENFDFVGVKHLKI